MAFPSKIEINGKCPECRETFELEYDGRGMLCQKCQHSLLPHATDNFKLNGEFDQCPVCSCQHLYRQRDFNRALGITLVIIASILALFTYGISLIILALVDWLVFRRVGEVGCCYECKATFRNEKRVAQLKPFELELHDYYRSLPSTQS